MAMSGFTFGWSVMAGKKWLGMHRMVATRDLFLTRVQEGWRRAF